MLVLRQGIHIVAIGLILGLVGAYAASRILRSFLYNVDPTDPLTFVGVVSVLVVAAIVACWIPARQATKVDPVQTLRYE